MLVLMTLNLLACREDPGAPEYPDPAQSPGDTGSTDDDFLSGSEPYVEGEARLSVGLFYEGGYSDRLEVDDQTRFYYIYDSTYTTAPDLDDRVEGYESEVLTHSGKAWWGGGITWSEPTDLSDWTQLHISFKADADDWTDFDLAVTAGGVEARVSAAAYGFTADGTWHHLTIPATAFSSQGADMSAVTAPLVLVGEGGEAGQQLWVDDHFWTQEVE